ncbi:alpha/beta fold hydrolase [Candidatus Woesearchaeota archaeon]|nr:alpha/beta fold hydrolase [Candidatus Woesearchaeota archaeon]
MKKVFLLVGFLVFIAGCDESSLGTQNSVKSREMLAASDGIKLSYSFVGAGSNAVILLHQLNSGKSAYAGFQEHLREDGFSSIAIDFRGHGDSDGEWQKFTEKDFKNMILDAEAAKAFLEGKGKKVVGIAGASIGANIAGQMTVKYGIKAVLLSPGLNYRGIDFGGTIPKLKDALIVVSNEDAYSVETAEKAKEENANIKFLFLENRGHGTDMLDEELEEEMAGFFEERK